MIDPAHGLKELPKFLKTILDSVQTHSLRVLHMFLIVLILVPLVISSLKTGFVFLNSGASFLRVERGLLRLWQESFFSVRKVRFTGSWTIWLPTEAQEESWEECEGPCTEPSATNWENGSVFNGKHRRKVPMNKMPTGEAGLKIGSLKVSRRLQMLNKYLLL